jgi:hypothetical protein
MGIEGFVNGHDREPEIRHEYIDEEEGSKEAQCHETQHGSRAPVRAPLRYGARMGKRFYPKKMEPLTVRADKLLVRNLPRPVT